LGRLSQVIRPETAVALNIILPMFTLRRPPL
jgi:hypothetical protein